MPVPAGNESTSELNSSPWGETELAAGTSACVTSRQAGFFPDGPVVALAADLLDAVEGGSSEALLEALSGIVRLDAAELTANDAEREQLDILRAVAVQMRLDLHAMLMHICQRLEATRSYLEVVKHLAGRPSEPGAPGWNPLLGTSPKNGARRKELSTEWTISARQEIVNSQGKGKM